MVLLNEGFIRHIASSVLRPNELRYYTCTLSYSVKQMFSHTTCGICSKSYDDPRILPCLHSFCQQCLNHEMESQGSQQVFKCPTCERSVSIPVGGANGLPRNLHLGFEVEVAGYISKIVSNSEVRCDECVDGRNGPAEVFCCTCYQFMCTFCHEHHKRSRKLLKHTMVGLDQEGASQLLAMAKPREHYCSQPNHGDNVMDLHCETCSLIVCRDCITDSHQDHAVIPLYTAARTHQCTISGALDDAKVAVTRLTGAIGGNDEMMGRVDTSRRNAFLVINQAIDMVQETLEKRRRELLEELETLSLSKAAGLTLQKEQFVALIEDIGHYTEVASHVLQTHTDHEVVALGGIVSTELQATLKKIQTMSLAPNQHSGTTATVQTDDFVREVSKLGQILQLSPASSTWASAAVAKAESRFHVKVESKTSNGDVYPFGGVHVEAEMRPMAHDGAVVCGEVEDHRDGTYTITLTPQTAGPHRLVITMDGQHVQNSPHDLDVIPKHNYLNICNAQQVINCSSPFFVAIHENGGIYVGSGDRNCIYVLDQAGAQKELIGSGGNGNLEFNRPLGICIKGDEIYVCDSLNHRIQKLSTNGRFLGKFGSYGTGRGQFNGPIAVVMDSNDRLIVSDWGNHRIQFLMTNGDWLSTIDGNGIGDHCFIHPWGLALDPQGNIHVAAYGSNSIKVFTADGTFVRLYGNPIGPKGIAIDNEGYSLVSEGDGDCLSIFDPEGKKIHTVGNLKNPKGIAVNPKNYSVFVAVMGSNAVLRYLI